MVLPTKGSWVISAITLLLSTATFGKVCHSVFVVKNRQGKYLYDVAAKVCLILWDIGCSIPDDAPGTDPTWIVTLILFMTLITLEAIISVTILRAFPSVRQSKSFKWSMVVATIVGLTLIGVMIVSIILVPHFPGNLPLNLAASGLAVWGLIMAIGMSYQMIILLLRNKATIQPKVESDPLRNSTAANNSLRLVNEIDKQLRQVKISALVLFTLATSLAACYVLLRGYAIPEVDVLFPLAVTVVDAYLTYLRSVGKTLLKPSTTSSTNYILKSSNQALLKLKSLRSASAVQFHSMRSLTNIEIFGNAKFSDAHDPIASVG